MAPKDKTASHLKLSGINLLHESRMTPWECLTFEVPGHPGPDIEGRTILDEAADRNLAISSDCGGKGLCGKCRVLAEPREHLSAVVEAESRLLSPAEIAAGYRLACQARILGPVSITVAANGSGAFEVCGKTGICGPYPVDSPVKQFHWSPTAIGDPCKSGARDAIGQAEACIEKLSGRRMAFRDLYPVREFSRFSPGNVPLTLTWHEKRGITAVVPGIRSRSLGVAADLGTTTLATYLCDLATGAVLASAAATNPQQRYGEDVLSRIAFAKEASDGTRTMQKLIAAEINALIVHCLDEVGAIREDVDEMVVVGNTTMQHLFAGINPRSLGGAPYLPVACAPFDLRAAEVGVELSPATNVHVFPVISGFVGGDTLGAIIAEAPHEHQAMTLIVDIGTNGEIVLGNRDGLWASSCAMGPAFEGAHISSGMRAAPGAIYQVNIDPLTYRANCEVLGGGDGVRPRGICGSGIIDAVAAMRRRGLLLTDGRIKAGLPGVETDERGLARRFILVPGEQDRHRP